jgi:long-chain acyl-CoA synthetase
MMDLAIMLNGAVSVPMFPNVSSENFDFQIKDAEISTLFIQSDELLDPPIQKKLLEISNIISYSLSTQGENVEYFQDVLNKGDILSDEEPNLYAKMRDEVLPDDLATIIYTSGSTGVPKGVEISHRNLCSQIQGAVDRFPLVPSKDKALSCLPLAHVFERMVMYYYISTGISVYFADDVKNVGNLLKQVKPTIITLVPRILEKVYAKMTSKADEEQGIKKLLLTKAIHLAKTADPQQNGILKKIFDKLVYSKMRLALGGNLNLVISGGAALNKDVGTFFLNIGLPLFEGYGLTETSPVLSANYPNNAKMGSVGKAFPGVELKISNEGELLARGENIMLGYHNNPEATKQMIDEEGWLHTGDKVTLDDDGFYTITGRIKELFKSSNGKYISPVPIEQAWSQNAIVDHAVVIAEGRRFVSILLFPDYETIANNKSKRGLASLNNNDFLNHDSVRRELEELMETINASLNHWEQVRKFVLIPHQLTIENGELTPKMNIRRSTLETQFSDKIDAFYDES